MKFATIAATVLVASSVLATAGVVSADDGVQDDGSFVKTGKAEVAVTDQGGVLRIDKAPGTTTNLHFEAITLTDFLNKTEVSKQADILPADFGVTNTTKTRDWHLTANFTGFKGLNNEGNLEGATLTFNPTGEDGKDIQLDGTANLFTSDATDTWNNASHTEWSNAQKGYATLTVPSSAKVGNYEANITYTLTSGVSGNTSSSTK